MDKAKIIELINQGEDSRTQFKENFTNSDQLAADEMLIPDSTVEDINYFIFNKFFETNYEQSVKETGQPIEKLLENLKLFRDGKLNLAGLLLFGVNPQKFKPIFIIKGVSFYGNDIAGTEYRNSEDIDGDIETLYKNGMVFLLRNLDKTQQGQDFNTLGILEVSKIALQEVLQNALIHRSYFKNAPVRLLVFDNRIEIISPGKLPNGLTVENIKYGNAVARNYILASFASKILPYRGLGTGIKRAIKEQPNIEFINDAEGEQFIVIIPRPPKER